MNLYDRQKSISLDMNQSITVIGCGGIGFWVAKYAAMSGIEKMYVYDPDTIDETNLNRLDVPYKFIGKNKADVVKLIVNALRPDCTVYAFPFRFNENNFGDTDWIIDCTDSYKAQLNNQKIAKHFGKKYLKAGYDGENFSIHNSVAEWGEAEDGYQIIPSWVVPASLIAGITVAKIMKYKSGEVSANIRSIFKMKDRM